MAEAVLGGHRSSYRHWGQGPRQMLALHCSLAHAGAWAGLAAQLPGGICLTAPDLPGHGRSDPWLGTEDLHSVATRMATALADQIGGPLDLIGHSFGATIALRLALERPDLVQRLILIEPVLFAAAQAVNAPEFLAFAAEYQAVDAAMEDHPEQAAALFHGRWGVGAFAALPEAQRAYMTARMPLVRAQNPVLLQDVAQMLAPGRLEALARPTLLIEGGDSPPVIAAIHRALADRLPMARRHVVAGAGHMLPITHPAEVAREILSL